MTELSHKYLLTLFKQDNKPKTLESWGSIADGASWLSVRCSYQPTITSFLYVVGQVFHPTHWNVIVRKDSC